MTDQHLDFADRVVLITGGATGIGRAAAQAFAHRGAKVVIGDVDDRAAETVKLIEDGGGTATFVETDVVSGSQVKNLVDTAVGTYGRLDAAFNNAGVLPPTAPLVEMTEEQWDQVVDVDLKGVFLSLKHELAHMVSAGGGAIVNMASVAGVIADPGMAPYVAAKHGVVGLTKAAGIEYAAQNVRVNAVAPGLVATPMTQRWLDDPEVHAALMANSPIGRPAQPEEIAGAVLFLCSDAASFMTGQVHLIDGGQTAH
jgi:NAD(P)-dependent dehydrogenase (short-subunit alcohol dehydrogenase family)